MVYIIKPGQFKTSYVFKLLNTSLDINISWELSDFNYLEKMIYGGGCYFLKISKLLFMR